MEREYKVEYVAAPVDLTLLAKAFLDQFLKQWNGPNCSDISIENLKEGD